MPSLKVYGLMVTQNRMASPLANQATASVKSAGIMLRVGALSPKRLSPPLYFLNAEPEIPKHSDAKPLNREPQNPPPQTPMLGEVYGPIDPEHASTRRYRSGPWPP